MPKDDGHCSGSASGDASDAASDAAAYNQRVLRKLVNAVARQPDMDLTSALPPQYKSKLASKRQKVQAAESGMAPS